MDNRGLCERLSQVQEHIHVACQRSHRNERDVLLVVVTKRHPVEAIQELFRQGQRHFGENRLPEALEKLPQLPDEAIWHMIGHLQSNKAKQAAQLSWVQSLSSVSAALALQKELERTQRSLEVLVEVKTSPEEAKLGLGSFEELEALAQALTSCSRLRVRGLMTMAPQTSDEGLIRQSFRTLRDWRERAASRFPWASWDHLSMGMSQDFELAIEEGSTLVRVGTAIMGPPPEETP